MAQIVLDQVHKVYAGGVTAVEGLDLDIRNGEFMVLVGPSGFGKSTALRMIAGLEEISSGTIQIGDRVVNELPPKDRDIAMVFQNYALYPHMSVVTFAGFTLPVPEEVLQARPGLDSYFGKDLIVGIRPSDFEDAGLGDGQWARMQVAADVIEELGSEMHVIFTIDAPPVEHTTTAALAAAELDEADAAIPLVQGKSQWTARVNARSAVRGGRSLELRVDTRNLQFFDTGSGLAIGHPAAAAVEAPA